VCTATRPGSARSSQLPLHLSLCLVHSPTPISTSRNHHFREERRRPTFLSNTPAPRRLHTRLFSWPSWYPCFCESIDEARNKTQCLLALENNSPIPSPPVLKICWHGPSSTMLMSFLPASTIFLVLSCAAGRCARGAPS